MFIDYVTLMLINMVAGLVLLAGFLVCGAGRPDVRVWAPGFFAVGLMGLLTGLYTAFTWPLPGVFNMAYGDTTAIFGTLFLAAALATLLNLPLTTVAVYGLVTAPAVAIIGYKMLTEELTQAPMMTALGFFLTAAVPVVTAVALWRKAGKAIRVVAAIVILAAALMWTSTAYMGVAAHLNSDGPFAQWTPEPMRGGADGAGPAPAEPAAAPVESIPDAPQ